VPAAEALLLRAVYNALATGDEDALLNALHPRFVARYASGMPLGGGVAVGPHAARDHWWQIGAAFKVRADIDEIIACADGRLLAVGTYRGTRRDDGHAVDARFMHLWTIADGRARALEQITDTARW
jgi:ketosteroid isomerase-like protein